MTKNMSLFKNSFGSSEKSSIASKINWITLSDLGQLDEIVNESTKKPVVIFKHSTRCSVSRMVLKNFEREYNLDDKMELYFLDLLEYRDISNEISTRFDVVHQSPQIIVIKEGNVFYNASHESIDATELKNLI